MSISLGDGSKLGIASTQVSPEETENPNRLAKHKDFKSIVKSCPVRKSQDQPASLLSFKKSISIIKLLSMKLS